MSTLVHVFKVILVEFIAVVLVYDVHGVLVDFFGNVPLCWLISQHVIRIGAVIRIVVISLVVILCLLTILELDCCSFLHNLLLFRVDSCLIVDDSLSLGHFSSLAHEILLFDLLFRLWILHLEQLVFDTSLCAFITIEQLAIILHISLSQLSALNRASRIAVVVLAERLDGVIALHVYVVISHLSLDVDFFTSPKWLRLFEFRHVAFFLREQWLVLQVGFGAFPRKSHRQSAFLELLPDRARIFGAHMRVGHFLSLKDWPGLRIAHNEI